MRNTSRTQKTGIVKAQITSSFSIWRLFPCPIASSPTGARFCEWYFW